jgi:hypothetical protein
MALAWTFLMQGKDGRAQRTVGAVAGGDSRKLEGVVSCDLDLLS